MKAIEGFLKRGQQPAPVTFILAIFKHLTDYKVKRDLTILPQRRIKVVFVASIYLKTLTDYH